MYLSNNYHAPLILSLPPLARLPLNSPMVFESEQRYGGIAVTPPSEELEARSAAPEVIRSEDASHGLL